MEYVGKMCPVCGTELKEGESVVICPSCGIVYHTDCWAKSGGCVTPGCSQNPASQAAPAQGYAFQAAPAQGYASQAAPAQGYAPQGAPAPAYVPPVNPNPVQICTTCGAVLEPGQAFCPRCGQPAAVQPGQAGVNPAIFQYNADVNAANGKKKGKGVLIAAIAAAVVVVVAAVLLLTGVFRSPQDYMAEADYEKAYDKADSSEKSDVLAENIVAYCSSQCVESLKDSASFDLRDAWYDPEGSYVVLEVSANNTYGNPVINYWLYTPNDDGTWGLFTNYTSLEEEEYYSYDTSDEMWEKAIKNVYLDYVLETMSYEYMLSSGSVNRINTLFESGLLDDVVLLSEGYAY